MASLVDRRVQGQQCYCVRGGNRSEFKGPVHWTNQALCRPKPRKTPVTKTHPMLEENKQQNKGKSRLCHVCQKLSSIRTPVLSLWNRQYQMHGASQGRAAPSASSQVVQSGLRSLPAVLAHFKHVWRGLRSQLCSSKDPADWCQIPCCARSATCCRSHDWSRGCCRQALA